MFLEKGAPEIIENPDDFLYKEICPKCRGENVVFYSIDFPSPLVIATLRCDNCGYMYRTTFCPKDDKS